MHEGLTQEESALIRPCVHMGSWHVTVALLRTTHRLNPSRHTHKAMCCAVLNHSVVFDSL